MRRALLLLALVGIGVGGCYAPSIDEGQFTCVESTKCPSGWRCHCQQCVPENKVTEDGCPSDMAVSGDDLARSDAALAVDLGADLLSHDLQTPADLVSSSDLTTAIADMAARPVCPNGGLRSTRDPGLTSVAFCPAAWKVPGVVTNTTPCNRQPTADGTNGAGVDCTAADNCGVGWHLCESETEVTTRGLTVTACSALDNATGELWITRQKGGPPPPPTQGPPVCDTSTIRTLFGCGGNGNMITTTCTVFRRALLDDPMMGGDQCAGNTQNAFACPGVNMTTGDAQVVGKAGRAGGGVICCLD